MINNPEETIRFISELDHRLETGEMVHVGLQEVKLIDYDAIVVLLAIMIRFKASKVDFNGDFPEDPHASGILKRSGFFESLYRRSFKPQDTYNVQTEHSIHTHANRNVDASLSASVIERATENVFGGHRRSQGIQRVLLELMQNTNNHASLDQQGERHWWLSVHHRRDIRKTYFTFVDFGVGIFNSLDNKTPGSKWFEWRSRYFSIFQRADNAQILRHMLAGLLHRTVTGQPFRGKGLPGIREVLDRNWISRLLVITNDVYADVSNDDYRLLRNHFRGTLVHWELDRSNYTTAWV